MAIDALVKLFLRLPLFQGLKPLQLTEIVRREDIPQKIFGQGWQVAGTGPEGLARRIKSDTAAMAEVIRRNNIRPG